MTTAFACCQAGESARGAARRMAGLGVRALVVTDARGAAIGVLTDRELLGGALAVGDPDRRVEALCPPPPPTLGPEDRLDRALSLMIRHRLAFLPVADDGRLVGLMELRPLVHGRDAEMLAALEGMARAATAEGLAAVFGDVEGMLGALVIEGVDLEFLGHLAATVTDRLVAHAVALTLARLGAEGRGQPGVPFCWLAAGSAGRREQITRTDQDHALVYADPPASDADQVHASFLALGAGVSDILAQAGFAPCPGRLMASEPSWCLARSTWAERIRQWAGHPEPAEVRAATLFFDFRAVEESDGLEATLRDWVIQAVRASPQFAAALVHDHVDMAPPLTAFGRLRLARSGEHRGGFDLKHLGVAPLTGIVRALALRRGIRATGTLARLRGLATAVFSPEEATDLAGAFCRLWGARLRVHLAQARAGHPRHDFLVPRALTPGERRELKAALTEVVRLERRCRALLALIGEV